MYTKLVQPRALYPPVSDPPLKINREERLLERQKGGGGGGRRLNGLKFHRVNLRWNIRRWPLRNQSREKERREGGTTRWFRRVASGRRLMPTTFRAKKQNKTGEWSGKTYGNSIQKKERKNGRESLFGNRIERRREIVVSSWHLTNFPAYPPSLSLSLSAECRNN